MTEETENDGSQGTDEEPSADGRSTADDVAQELKEHEDEMENDETQ